MFSSTGSTKPRPSAVDIPQSVATDDDEGDTGANSLLAGEAIRTLNHSQADASSSQEPASFPRSESTLDTVVAIPDTYDADSLYDSALSPPASLLQGVDEQPLLHWRQPRSPPPRLQRRQSELLASPARVNAGVHRSMRETADARSNDHQSSSNTSTPQPFYGVEPRRPPKRDASSQLLRGTMRAPYRQRSMLSRGSPPLLLEAERRRKSHEFEAARPSHGPEMIEMISNPLSRITSDGPESSVGSQLVELSPDSYEPLQSVILDTQPIIGQLPVMPEEEPEVCFPTASHPSLLLLLQGLHKPESCSCRWLLLRLFGVLCWCNTGVVVLQLRLARYFARLLVAASCRMLGINSWC